MATVFFENAAWVSNGDDMMPGDVHVWSSVWDALAYNDQGGGVVRYAMVQPLTNYHMDLSLEQQFVEGNPNGWVLVFNVKNVGTNPVREYVVNLSTITSA
jgi:hypothetical protein